MKHTPMKRSSRKLRKQAVAFRYGASERSIDRWSQNPNSPFPKPKYFAGSRIPFWDEGELDAFDAKMAEAA